MKLFDVYMIVKRRGVVQRTFETLRAAWPGGNVTVESSKPVPRAT